MRKTVVMNVVGLTPSLLGPFTPRLSAWARQGWLAAGASAAIAVPMQNRPRPRTYTVRVVSRCSRNPVVGMTTAMVSMNAVESHCAVFASIDRSIISVGSATLMMVSLRITTNVATSSVPITLRSRLDIRPDGRVSVVVVDVVIRTPACLCCAYPTVGTRRRVTAGIERGLFVSRPSRQRSPAAHYSDFNEEAVSSGWSESIGYPLCGRGRGSGEFGAYVHG